MDGSVAETVAPCFLHNALFLDRFNLKLTKSVITVELQNVPENLPGHHGI